MGIINVTPDSFAGDGLLENAPEQDDFVRRAVANADPTPFVWGGKRHQRRERARLRRPGGSGAAFVRGYSIAA